MSITQRDCDAQARARRAPNAHAPHRQARAHNARQARVAAHAQISRHARSKSCRDRWGSLALQTSEQPSINPPDPGGSFDRAPNARAPHRQARAHNAMQARVAAHAHISGNERSQAGQP